MQVAINITIQEMSVKDNPYFTNAKTTPTKASSHRYAIMDFIGKYASVFIFKILAVFIHNISTYMIEITSVATAGPNIDIPNISNMPYSPKLNIIFAANKDIDVYIRNLELPFAAITK